MYRLDRGTHRGQPRDTGGAGYWAAEKPDSKSGYVWPFSLPRVILICRYRCRQSGEDLEPMAQYRVIIAGGRHFNNYPMLSNYADKLLERRRAAGDDIVIISGHCYGTDLLGERYARERGYRLEIFEAKWSVYGPAAGPKRNAEMAEHADALIAMWDGQSRDTKSMIEIARAKGLAVRVKQYKGD